MKDKKSLYDYPAVLWSVRILNILSLLLAALILLGNTYGHQALLYWYAAPILYMVAVITTVMHIFGHVTHRYRAKGDGEKRQAMRVVTLVLSGIVILFILVPYYALGIVMNRETSYSFLELENGQRIAIVSNTGPTFQDFTAYRMKDSFFADTTPSTIDDANLVEFETENNEPRAAEFTVQMKGDTAYITVICGKERKTLFVDTVPQETETAETTH